MPLPSPRSDGSPLSVAPEEFARRVVKVRHDLRNPLGHIMGFTELLLEAARTRGAIVLIPSLEEILRATDEIVSAINRTIDPQNILTFPASLAAMQEQIDSYCQLALRSVESCRVHAVAKSEPFQTDFSRIAGAAEQLLQLTPLLGTLNNLLIGNLPPKGVSPQRHSNPALAGLANPLSQDRVTVGLNRFVPGIMPAPIAQRLEQGERLIVDEFRQASVLSARLCQVDRLTSQLGGPELLTRINDLFARFDLLSKKVSLQPFRPQLNRYRVVSGVPTPRPDHGPAAAGLALSMQKEAANFREGGTNIHLQIILTTGPVMAGVIGWEFPAYDIWGAAVDQAENLESCLDGLPEDIIIADALTQSHLPGSADWQCHPLDPGRTKASGPIYSLTPCPS